MLLHTILSTAFMHNSPDIHHFWALWEAAWPNREQWWNKPHIHMVERSVTCNPEVHFDSILVFPSVSQSLLTSTVPAVAELSLLSYSPCRSQCRMQSWEQGKCKKLHYLCFRNNFVQHFAWQNPYAVGEQFVFCPLKDPSLWMNHMQWFHRALTSQCRRLLVQQFALTLLAIPLPKSWHNKAALTCSAPSRYPPCIYQSRAYSHTSCWKYISPLYFLRTVAAYFWGIT